MAALKGALWGLVTLIVAAVAYAVVRVALGADEYFALMLLVSAATIGAFVGVIVTRKRSV